MKTLQIIAAILVVYLFGINRVHSQSITLTFSGIKDGQPVTLDRIEIHNLDKGCDTNLYYPATSLLLQPLGIGDPLSGTIRFTVFQNVPNPAEGQTAVTVFQPEAGLVSVMVTELTGHPGQFRVISFYSRLFRGDTKHQDRIGIAGQGRFMQAGLCRNGTGRGPVENGLPGRGIYVFSWRSLALHGIL